VVMVVQPRVAPIEGRPTPVTDVGDDRLQRGRGGGRARRRGTSIVHGPARIRVGLGDRGSIGRRRGMAVLCQRPRRTGAAGTTSTAVDRG